MTRSRSDPTRRLPNFLVIGAMKAGTTSLYHYLKEHPQVFMAPVKELDFFAPLGNWDRGLAWYRAKFAGSESSVAVGEASTAYSKYPLVDGVPDRIAQLLPDCRFVYVVRNPIDRIRSHFQHRVSIGAERAVFSEAIERDPRYVSCSRYALQIERYLEYFRRNQILLITAEDLLHSRAPTMREVYAFLGVNDGFVPENLNEEYYRTSARATYPPAAWKLRRALKEHVPGAKRAKEFVDSTLPRLLSRLPTGDGSAENQVVSVSDDVRRWLVDELKHDVGRLRAYMPASFDGWGIG